MVRQSLMFTHRFDQYFNPFKGGLVFGAQIFASLFHPLAKTQL